DGSGIDRRAARRAERLLASVAALGRLHVDRGSAGQKGKRARLRHHHRPEGGPGGGLAVGAVANDDSRRVDLRLESDAAAMTAAFDLHGPFLSSALSGAVRKSTRTRSAAAKKVPRNSGRR